MTSGTSNEKILMCFHKAYTHPCTAHVRGQDDYMPLGLLLKKSTSVYGRAHSYLPTGVIQEKACTIKYQKAVHTFDPTQSGSVETHVELVHAY